MVRHYIEELVAMNIFRKSDASSKTRVSKLSAMFDQIMQEAPLDDCLQWLKHKVLAHMFEA